MWLLSTATLELKFFQDDRFLRYAIFSHRWREGEVLFHDVQNGKAREKAGFDKLQRACQQALNDTFGYIWIDTCCIDKSSSAELSEAINSMYRWYSEATICYAYLFDVVASDDSQEAANSFRASAWFTRGWTLQELIAPRHVEFLNQDWQPLGTRKALRDDIHMVTGIPMDLLAGDEKVDDFSIAQRMSWAAGRVTTRVEDVAYSLMGLFDVNMPMLYGEGESAFIRLQEEIMKDSDDESIFAWSFSSHIDHDAYSGLVANTPAQFAGCGRVVKSGAKLQREHYEKTNRGLRIKLTCRHHTMDVYHVALDCEKVDDNGVPHRVGIFLGSPPRAEKPEGVARRVYADRSRLEFDLAGDSQQKEFARGFQIPMQPFPNEVVRDAHFGFVLGDFRVRVPARNPHPERLWDLSDGVHVVARPDTWDRDTRILTLPTGTNGIAMCFAVTTPPARPWLVGKLGFDLDFCPILWIGSALPPSMVYPSSSRRSATSASNRGLPATTGQVITDPTQRVRVDAFSPVGTKLAKDSTVRTVLDDRTYPTGQEGVYKVESPDGLVFDMPHLSLQVQRIKKRGDAWAWQVDVEVRIGEGLEVEGVERPLASRIRRKASKKVPPTETLG